MHTALTCCHPCLLGRRLPNLLLYHVVKPGCLLAVEQGLKYNESHEWVKVEGDTATIGISDFAQVRKTLPDIWNTMIAANEC